MEENKRTKILQVGAIVITSACAFIFNNASISDVVTLFSNIKWDKPDIWVRLVVNILFIASWLWYGLSRDQIIKEYKSHKGELGFLTIYTKPIIIHDVRLNQRYKQINSSTGSLPAMLLDIEDEVEKPKTFQHTFLLVDVINYPKINTTNRIAKHVKAEIVFFDKEIHSIKQDCRWAFSKESDWYIGKDHQETISIDLHCNEDRALIIAFKDKNDCIYCLNQSSYKSKELTNPDCQLVKDSYDVRLRVWADNAEEIKQWFNFNIHDFTIRPSGFPDWYKKQYDC